MNCGRPQDHRWHDREPGYSTLPNGCSYYITQPETLWDAVLRPALTEAARAVGVDDEQAFRAVWREMHPRR